jgi:hypothetical protein
VAVEMLVGTECMYEKVRPVAAPCNAVVGVISGGFGGVGKRRATAEICSQSICCDERAMLPSGATSSPKEKSDELTKAQVALGAISRKLGVEKLSGARKSGSR